MRELIHFAHGNGFPAGCYQQMLGVLSQHFDCCYIDKIGHNPAYPVVDNWHSLVQELLDSIKRQAQQPVIALGHSLGGILSFFAAIEEPQLFKQVILLDSPLIGPFKSQLLKLAKALGIVDRITPASRTKERRTHWENYEQVWRYLKSRDLFKTFSDPCLEDYIRYGLESKEDGYHLRFSPLIEYQIYRTIPHMIPQYEGKLLVPTSLIYGDQSTVVRPKEIEYMEQKFKIQTVKVKGTHVFPMEDPEQIAKQIIKLVIQ